MYTKYILVYTVRVYFASTSTYTLLRPTPERARLRWCWGDTGRGRPRRSILLFFTTTKNRKHKRTWSRVSPCATIPPSFPLPATTARESPAFATHTFKPRTKATTAVQPPKSALMPAAGKAALISRNTSSKALWTTTTSADWGGGEGWRGGRGVGDGGGESRSHMFAHALSRYK